MPSSGSWISIRWSSAELFVFASVPAVKAKTYWRNNNCRRVLQKEISRAPEFGIFSLAKYCFLVVWGLKSCFLLVQ